MPTVQRHLIKTIESANRKARVYFYQRPDGRFEDGGDSEQEEDGEVFWAPSEFSGIYDTLETAKREARALVPWLRDENRQ